MTREAQLRSARAAAPLLLLGAASLACSPQGPGRVLLVGIDGASMRVVAPLLARGELPHLSAIARAGVSGPLRSQHPIDSPPVWNTIVTGVTPKKHGIRGFAWKDEAGDKRLYLSTDRKVPAVWNIVAASGRRVGVVNFWNTYPPDRIDGAMISDHVLVREVDGRAKINKAAIPDEGATVYPPEWAERFRELLDENEPLTSVANPFRDNDRLPPWVRPRELARRFEEDGALARVALAIERELRPDLMMVLLPGVDRVSHHLWGNLEPAELYPPRLRPGDEARAAGVQALHDYYRYQDAIVGELVASYGPDDLVIVLSDHGFESGTALLWLTGKHETEASIEGILFARGPGIGPAGGDTGSATVGDITPTILAWLGIPIGEDMDGRPLSFLEPTLPVTTISSHQGTPVEKASLEPSGAEADILERLRTLGYLEE